MGPAYWILIAVFSLCVIGYIVYLARKNRPQPVSSVAESGRLVCPFCSSVIADDVKYLGQTVSCPSCCSSFNAPNHYSPSGIPHEAVINIVGGIAMIGFAIWLMTLL